MGYAEVYRRSRKPWKRILRGSVYAAIFGVLLYFSLQLLGAQSGLMVGGAMPGRDTTTAGPAK
ncbi:MAG TPA: hypothetical protein PK250_08515 [Syntrophobacter fumaroxidans]|nr:hypothetical protein [Syntrophobacter fumaroxidans]